MATSGFHEDFGREGHAVGSTNRNFGLVVGGILTLIGLALGWYERPSGWWFLGIGMVLVATALVRPDLLAVPNRLWTKLGLLLFHVVNPVVMAILYYLCIVPMGLVMKLFRHDPLKLRSEPGLPTYWVRREKANPSVHDMRNQF